MDVVGPRQRQRAPPVARSDEATRTARRHPAAARQTEQCRPAGQQLGGVHRDTETSIELVGRRPGVAEDGGTGEVGATGRPPGQVGQSRGPPVPLQRVHSDIHQPIVPAPRTAVR
jgi:hypothetical protein